MFVTCSLTSFGTAHVFAAPAFASFNKGWYCNGEPFLLHLFNKLQLHVNFLKAIACCYCLTPLWPSRRIFWLCIFLNITLSIYIVPSQLRAVHIYYPVVIHTTTLKGRLALLSSYCWEGGGGLSLSITVRIIIFPYINRYLTVIFKFPSHPIPVVGILANHIIRTNFGGGQGGGGQGAIVHTIGSWKIPQLKTEVWGVVFSPPPPLTIGQVLSSMDSATKKTSIFHKWVFRNWFNKSLLLNPTIVESHCRLDGATGKRDSLHTTIKELVDRPALIIISHESCHQQENTNWRLLPGSGELNASINLALEVWLQKLKLV